jgi:Protein of unknown function (DUF1615)
MVGSGAPLRIWLLAGAAALAGCAGGPPTSPQYSPADARAIIDESLPRALSDRSGWLNDIYAAFTVLTVQPSHENVCAVVAVIQQESGFQVDPVIPNLGIIARREIDSRAERAHLPLMVVHGVLGLKSPDGLSYSERIDHARTEKDLSDIYEDFISSVPMGRTLFDDKNPIRTRGPMQVNVAFANEFAAAAPYPYPVKRSIADEVFTRRGSIYFGVAHLLDYRGPYDDYVFRFADYNAGQYASRNAAFQHAVSVASGIALDADGALLPGASAAEGTGATELALRALGARLALSEASIHAALQLGKQKSFEQSTLYQRVFELADKAAGAPLPRALLPSIELQGPKIKRRLTTEWYARRVDQRFHSCLKL